jgi:hypothetical protein
VLLRLVLVAISQIPLKFYYVDGLQRIVREFPSIFTLELRMERSAGVLIEVIKKFLHRQFLEDINY